MKAFFFIPKKYSLYKSIINIFKEFNVECFHLDFRDNISAFHQRINTQIFRLPYSLRAIWNSYYLVIINKWYINKVNQLKPDILFIYNNEMFLPETLKHFKESKIKIAFFLGDNPLFTRTNPYNLSVLEYADVIFVPDSYWQFQLQKTGLKNIFLLFLPMPVEDYYPIDTFTIDNTFKQEHQADIFYAGMSYNDSWGYKKAKFLSYFTEFDLRIYGNKAWEKWLTFFPELGKHFVLNKSFIPVQDLNKMFNLAKIIPVDGNPGIFNGIHLRVIEALSAGVLPIFEYNKDMEFVFEGIVDIPCIKDYSQIPEITRFYLNNTAKRHEIISSMHKIYSQKFNNKTIGDFFLNNLLK